MIRSEAVVSHGYRCFRFFLLDEETCFPVVAAIALFLGGIGFFGAVKNESAMEEVGGVRLPAVQSLLEMKAAMQSIIIKQRTLLNPDNTTDMRQLQYRGIEEDRSAYGAAFEIYQSLRQSAEEAREWEELMRIIPQWAALNDEIFDLHQELDRIDILNPEQLLAELQQFRADHHSLSVDVANMILLGDMFEGGDDASACAYGRWLADFETANPELLDPVSSLENALHAFHDHWRSSCHDAWLFDYPIHIQSHTADRGRYEQRRVPGFLRIRAGGIVKPVSGRRRQPTGFSPRGDVIFIGGNVRPDSPER